LGRRLPLNYRKLGWLVVAAHGDDRVVDLPRALDRFPAEQALWAGPFNSSRSDCYLDAHRTSNGIPITPALPGHTLDLGDGSRLEVIAVGQRGDPAAGVAEFPGAAASERQPERFRLAGFRERLGTGQRAVPGPSGSSLFQGERHFPVAGRAVEPGQFQAIEHQLHFTDFRGHIRLVNMDQV
jgi:hypothetical protein